MLPSLVVVAVDEEVMFVPAVATRHFLVVVPPPSPATVVRDHFLSLSRLPLRLPWLQ